MGVCNYSRHFSRFLLPYDDFSWLELLEDILSQFSPFTVGTAARNLTKNTFSPALLSYLWLRNGPNMGFLPFSFLPDPKPFSPKPSSEDRPCTRLKGASVIDQLLTHRRHARDFSKNTSKYMRHLIYNNRCCPGIRV